MIFLGAAPEQMITAPVIPEDVPLKCSYAPEQNAWRCTYPSFWRQPAAYSVLITAIASLGLGVLVGSSKSFQRVISKAAELIPG